MLIIPAILENITTRKDKTVRLSFGTQELTVEQISELYKSIQSYVFMALKSDLFKTQEKEIIEGIEVDYADNTKTHSQRLRSVLFVYWKQNNQGYKDFKDFYYYQLENLITHFKSKLEPDK